MPPLTAPSTVAIGLAHPDLQPIRATGTLHDLQTFILYTGMGVVTTLLFWGFELGFNATFHDKSMRYVGALLGLGLGYWAKYHLDKRFVFRTQVAP